MVACLKMFKFCRAFILKAITWILDTDRADSVFVISPCLVSCLVVHQFGSQQRQSYSIWVELAEITDF